MSESENIQNSFEQLTNKASELGVKSLELLEELTPTAGKLLYEVARIHAMKEVLITIFLGILGFLVWKTFKHLLPSIDKIRSDFDKNGLKLVCMCTVGIMWVPFISHAVKVHIWIGIFYPEIYIAYELITKIIK